jgi:hypothetical protein
MLLLKAEIKQSFVLSQTPEHENSNITTNIILPAYKRRDCG